MDDLTRNLTGPIVVLGAGGMLGRCWREALGDRPDVRYAARADADIADPAAVRAAIPDGTRLVVNAAAYTDVDGAEADEATATRVNGEAVGVLAERCAEVGATLAHYSTDYVFNGRATAPYPVDAPRDPLGAYGRSKAVGERRLESSDARFLCLRTSWLYAPHGKNFLTTIARLCRERDHLNVVDDQRGRPTSADQLVRTTAAMLDAGATGFHHACDGGSCSWYGFACAIRDAVDPACSIDPCTSDAFPRPAPRPAYSVLDLARTEALVGAIPHWTESVARALQRLGAGAATG